MLARLKNFIFGDEETIGFNKLPRATSDETNLRKLSRSELDLIMRATLPEWESVSAELARIHPIEDMKTGGVNPGDRRAVYYLIRSLRPANVLEIGTHVGASTLHIAAGLEAKRRRRFDYSGYQRRECSRRILEALPTCPIAR